MSPTTEYVYLTVEGFVYDVWHPPGLAVRKRVEADIAGNVTQSFEKLLADEDSLLWPLVSAFGLQLSPVTDPKVTLLEGDEVEVDIAVNKTKTCVQLNANLIENIANTCERYSLALEFRHKRGVDSGIVEGWILAVSHLVSGDLVASYQGSKSVISDQRITFKNAYNVREEDRAEFCTAIREQLVESEYLDDYLVLGVDCEGFLFDPQVFALRGRRLQEEKQWDMVEEVDEVGTLSVDFSVSGRYTPANREQDIERQQEFSPRVSVSDI